MCNICSTPKVEDEMHFLYQCSMYDDLRPLFKQNTLLPLEFDTLDNFEKTRILCDGNNIKQFGKVTEMMFIRRR